MEYYIHQIGDIHDDKTYEILVKILKSKTIASRKYLEQIGEKWDDASATFKKIFPKIKNGCIIKMIFIRIECHYLILLIDLLKKQ